MTMTRRDVVSAFAVFAGLIAAAREAGTQTPTAPPRGPIKFDLPNLSMDGWEVTVSHVDYPPGRVGSAHRHAGFVLAYVHEESGNTSQTEPAQLLAMIFAKKGSTLTTPVTGRGGEAERDAS